MEQIIKETVSKCLKDKKVTGTDQLGFTKGVSHLTSLL